MMLYYHNCVSEYVPSLQMGTDHHLAKMVVTHGSSKAVVTHITYIIHCIPQLLWRSDLHYMVLMFYTALRPALCAIVIGIPMTDVNA